MAPNLKAEATRDVADAGHDLAQLAQKMAAHAGSPMYLAEVAELLRLTRRWDDFKRAGHARDLVAVAERQPDRRTDDPLEQQATERVIEPVDHARAELRAAQRRLAQLDDELQHQLHELGPALWNPHESDDHQRDAQRRRVAAYIAD